MMPEMINMHRIIVVVCLHLIQGIINASLYEIARLTVLQIGTMIDDDHNHHMHINTISALCAEHDSM